MHNIHKHANVVCRKIPEVAEKFPRTVIAKKFSLPVKFLSFAENFLRITNLQAIERE